MDADATNTTQEASQENEEQPTPPQVHMVARSAAEIDNINTIDIIGEKPFSI